MDVIHPTSQPAPPPAAKKSVRQHHLAALHCLSALRFCTGGNGERDLLRASSLAESFGGNGLPVHQFCRSMFSSPMHH